MNGSLYRMQWLRLAGANLNSRDNSYAPLLLAAGEGRLQAVRYLLDEGAFKFNEANGTFSVDAVKIAAAVRKLTGEILTIEAEGSYDKAKALLEKYAVIRPSMQKALDGLGKVPVDIEPSFPLAR